MNGVCYIIAESRNYDITVVPYIGSDLILKNSETFNDF